MNSDDQDQTVVDEVFEAGKSFTLPVGTPLQIEIEGVTVKLNSVSAGWVPEDYLIIKQPISGFGSLSSKLFRGNKITVRYISGGDVFAFQSELVGSSEFPRLIFVAYPKLVVRHSLRGNRRILCYLPGELSKETGDSALLPDTVHGIVSDLSLSGCAFEMMKTGAETGLPDVKVEDKVRLHIQFPGHEKMVEFSGQVRRTTRDGKRLNLGIQFQGTVAETEARAADYLQTMEKFA